MERGYIKLWRKMLDSRSASRGLQYVGAMCWLILNANWSDGWFDGSPVGRGQLVVSRAILAFKWHTSEQSIRTILKNLETDGFLTSKSTNKSTIITICNYEVYQVITPAEQPTNQPATNQRPTSDQPHLKNNKNNNNNIYNIYSDSASDATQKTPEKLFEVETVFSFDEFWDAYDKKNGKKNCEKLYAKISEQERAKIKEHVPKYVAATPEKKYRKDPQTYLHGECWNDEIITNNCASNGNAVFDRKNRATHPGDEEAGKEFTNGF